MASTSSMFTAYIRTSEQQGNGAG